mmetsp:Transcript_102000/g.200043  ORF Transcript_102000/g.200043 Transcript_102000/m.200043 type:complete len:248 (+) Transcript_102000:288-1031(+)
MDGVAVKPRVTQPPLASLICLVHKVHALEVVRTHDLQRELVHDETQGEQDAYDPERADCVMVAELVATDAPKPERGQDHRKRNTPELLREQINHVTGHVLLGNEERRATLQDVHERCPHGQESEDPPRMGRHHEQGAVAHARRDDVHVVLPGKRHLGGLENVLRLTRRKPIRRRVPRDEQGQELAERIRQTAAAEDNVGQGEVLDHRHEPTHELAREDAGEQPTGDHHIVISLEQIRFVRKPARVVF